MSLLEVRDVSVDYLREDGTALHAVEEVGFTLHEGRSLGLVGESGCGKTSLILSILRLLPAQGRIVSGEVLYRGTDLFSLSEGEMRKYRWNRLSLVFQGAMNALNPVRRVGDQIGDAVKLHESDKIDRDVEARVHELLELVGISPQMSRHYPHQYSGGMRQRAMIAMALACSPDILIADEPTTALDVMVQAQILELLQNLQQRLALSVVMVTHDLGVVAEMCDDVLVMYGGRTAEYADVDTIFNDAQHPYTQRLLQSFPDLANPSTKLISIPGYPPTLDAIPHGCRFEPRCDRRRPVCASQVPALETIDPGHQVACPFREDP